MRWRTLLVLALVTGCGAAPPAKAPSTRIEPSEKAVDEEPAEPAPLGPGLFGILGDDDELNGYVHVERLAGSAVFKAGLQAMLAVAQNAKPGAPDPLTEVQSRCGFDALEAVREATFTATPSQHSFGALLALNIGADRVLACVQQFESGFTPVQVEGLDGIARDDLHFLVREDQLLVGTRDGVNAFHRLPRMGTEGPNGTYLHLSGKVDHAMLNGRVAASLMPARSGTRLELEARTPDDSQATLLEQKLRAVSNLAGAYGVGLPPELQQALSRIVKSFELGRDGTTVHAALTLEDAVFSGAFSAMAVHGVQRYMLLAKTSEARSTLVEISSQLSAYAMKQRKPRFPPSAPLTPSVVPAGSKYTSTPQEWEKKSWHAIGFSRQDPQYYSYEFETSRDGQRVTIRARGDLDGDGVESRYELAGEIDARGATNFGPAIREDQPEE